MENYAEMLQALADTFGTTVEHLWGVLVKQAAISASIDLVLVFTGWVIVFWAFGFIKQKTTEPAQVEGERHKYAEWQDEGALVAWIVFAMFSLYVTTASVANAHDIISGFTNPEYWALMKIKG